MKKNLCLLVLSLSAVVMFTPTVHAWDDLIHLTRHAVIGDPGRLKTALAVRYVSAGDNYDQDGEKHSLADDVTGIRVPIWLRYYITENFKTFAILPIVSTDDGTISETGLGDIWLGAKYGLLEEGLMTIRGALDIPTGDDVKNLGNAGGFGIDIAALTEKKIDNLGLTGQLGVRYNGEDSDTKWSPGIGFHVSGRVEYGFKEKYAGIVSLSYFNQGDGELDGTEAPDSMASWLELGVGVGYAFSNGIWVVPALEYTLTGTNTNAELGITIYSGYTFRLF